MGIFNCNDCNHIVSTNAESCPGCGNTFFYKQTGGKIIRRCKDCDGTGTQGSGKWSSLCSGCGGNKNLEFQPVIDLKRNKKGWIFKRNGFFYESIDW